MASEAPPPTVGYMPPTTAMPGQVEPTAPAGTALIGLTDVGRRYQVGDNEVTALSDVTLEIAAEDFVVVLGPSGSGKTTLLNIIGALDSPTDGRVVVAGQDITRASRKELFAFRRHGVSFVFQTFNLFPALGLYPFTYVLTVVTGTVIVALAPLLTLRRLRRVDIPSTLRVVE
jgi:ABC-type polar amino acid transport system ATPase subunit